MVKPLIVPLIFTNTAAVEVELDEIAVDDGATDERAVDDGAIEEVIALVVNELVAAELIAIELAVFELVDAALERFAGLSSPPPPPHAARVSAVMAALKRSRGNIRFLPVINLNYLHSASSVVKSEREQCVFN